jgi:hypothetical protein
MSTSSRAAARRKVSRPTAADRSLAKHLDRCANLDTDKLNEAGWGIGILDGMGSTIAELSDITLREAIAAVKSWELFGDGGFEIVPPAGKAVN